MERELLVAEIKTLVISSLGLPLDFNAIHDDEPLWGGRYHVGSMAALEILMVLEDRFGVQFPDEAIDLSLFTSIRRLADAVSKLLPDATDPKTREVGES
jgi:acyl carrier protein